MKAFHHLAAICLVSAVCLSACQATELGSTNSTSSLSEPGAKDIAECEKNTRAFLASDYTSDDSVALRYFTPPFAKLWLWATNPPEGETNFWGADPILETQDDEPELLNLGPGRIVEGKVRVPVDYRFRFPGGRTFTKEFVFVRSGSNWLITDILTTDPEIGTTSEFAVLSSAKASGQ